MRALLDVNVLLALMDRDHVHHRAALEWWRSDRDNGWASCPLTQNGFVRISCQGSFPGRPTAAWAIEQLRRQIADSDHVFWPDDLSIVDEGWFDRSRILGPNQIADIYLLALAVKNGGRFVTFDRGVGLHGVRRAEPRHLVTLFG
jgi:toxin-antitoxin system PIN domain toxin